MRASLDTSKPFRKRSQLLSSLAAKRTLEPIVNTNPNSSNPSAPPTPDIVRSKTPSDVETELTRKKSVGFEFSHEMERPSSSLSSSSASTKLNPVTRRGPTPEGPPSIMKRNESTMSLNFQPLSPLIMSTKAMQASDILNFIENSKNEMEKKIDRLNNGCDQFQIQFKREVDMSTKRLEQNLVNAFLHLAKSKLPEVYLRSLPKFGGNQISNALHQSLVDMKRSSEANKQKYMINLKFNQEIMNDISSILEATIKKSFGDFVDVIVSMSGTINSQVVNLKQNTENLGNLLGEMRIENMHLIEKLEEAQRTIETQAEEVENLKLESKEKELQMDILRKQVKSRDELLTEQSTAFHKELMQLRMKLYEKDRFGGLQSKLEEIPPGEFSLRFAQTAENRDAISKATEDLNQKMLELLAEAKKSFVREKRNIVSEKKVALEEKDLQIADLRKRVKRLEEKLRSMQEVINQQHEIISNANLANAAEEPNPSSTPDPQHTSDDL